MNKKTVAIIQARMESTRLSGKVFMDIEGKPMMWHVINRVRQSRLVDEVTVATTTDVKDDKIADYCLRENVPVVRGSREDVLDRYYQAACQRKASVIVRITSDCPLMDPGVIDEVVDVYQKNKESAHGACNIIKRTYPRGLDVEVFSFDSLAEIWNYAVDPLDREHVTRYFYTHLNNYKLMSVENSVNISRYRWTVDEDADFRFVREVYGALYGEGKIFSCSDIVALLESQPELVAINANVKQKKDGEVLS